MRKDPGMRTTTAALDEIQAKIDAERLRPKYLVHKAETGEPVDGCFVLRPERDPAARAALAAYASAAALDQPFLAADLRLWLHEMETAATKPIDPQPEENR